MFSVADTIRNLIDGFDSIPAARKKILSSVSTFINDNKSADLIFICTHNSRRSHIAHIWATTAAAYFKIDHVKSYSGGTEATSFNPRAAAALNKIGFKI